MRNSNSKSDELDWEMRPGGMLLQRRDDLDLHDDHGDLGPMFRINVSHGSTQHELYVPAQSTFGDVKKVLEQKTGLEPQRQRLLFRGKDKEDEEHLGEAGVKDKSKLLLLEELTRKDKDIEETKESEEMSKAVDTIAKIRAEVDKLAERVSVLQVAVKCGTQVSCEEFVAATELLMNQLLKLDTIEAKGEGKEQRKAEVRRIQGLHDILDNMREANSNPVSNKSNSVSVSTQWETFDSGVGSLSSPPPPSPSTKITQDWEQFD